MVVNEIFAPEIVFPVGLASYNISRATSLLSSRKPPIALDASAFTGALLLDITLCSVYTTNVQAQALFAPVKINDGTLGMKLCQEGNSNLVEEGGFNGSKGFYFD